MGMARIRLFGPNERKPTTGTTAFDQTPGYGKYRSKTLLLIVCTRFTARTVYELSFEQQVINTFFRPTEKRLSDV